MELSRREKEVQRREEASNHQSKTYVEEQKMMIYMTSGKALCQNYPQSVAMI